MAKEKTHIQKLYENPKAKKFVNHLIQAYLPLNKSVKVFDFEKNQKAKCNVCGQQLMSLNQVLQKYHENSKDIMKETLENIRKEFSKEDKEERKKEDNPIFKYVSKGKVLAWTGEKTNTCLCLDCVQSILDLVQTGLLIGDKNINWLMNKMKRGQVFNHFKESSSLSGNEKEKIGKIEKKIERSKTKKVTLGDFKVLQDLKEKMEKNQ